jgi:hypothetical protein
VEVKVCKVEPVQHLVFGWASVAESDGQLVVDSDGEAIETAELEKAVYQFVRDSGEAGELHQGEPVAKVVESLMLTAEKAGAMGLAAPAAEGWWVGVKIEDAGVFAKVSAGKYCMFSIQGTAERHEITA